MKNQNLSKEQIGLFATHPSVNAFYVTSDDQAFFTEDNANSHATRLADKSVITITRPDVDVEDSDETNNSVKAELKDFVDTLNAGNTNIVPFTPAPATTPAPASKPAAPKVTAAKPAPKAPVAKKAVSAKPAPAPKAPKAPKVEPASKAATPPVETNTNEGGN